MKTHLNHPEKRKLQFIYWFAYYNFDSPCVRFRAQYPLEFLKKNYDIDSLLIVPGYKPQNILRFLPAYFSALLFRKPGSLIVIQRVSSNFIYANLLKLLVKFRKTKTMYDLDDAEYLQPKPGTIFYFIKNCSIVSVGSLQMFLRLSSLNNNIVLNTSPVPDLQITKRDKNTMLTIGWVGGFGWGHKESLASQFFPALKNLPFKVKLVLLGVNNKPDYEFLQEYFKNLENVLVEMPQDINWKNEADIQRRIAEFDIGIATLLDTEYQRSKSGIKLKQYLNNGVPALSTNLPENNALIEHGINGFLCSGESDFRQRIIEIHEMSNEQYKILSVNARNSTLKLNLSRYCHQLIAAYEND